MSPVPVAPTEREPHLQAFRAHVDPGEAGEPGDSPGAAGPVPVPRPAHDPGSFDSLLDRLAAWRGDPRLGLAVVALVALAAGFVWYRGALAGDPGLDSDVVGADEPLVTTTVVEVGPAVVHVSGAVGSPGVYRLEPGSRVTEAVEQAGGVVDGADLDRLNLAAPVADGQRVHVPKVGEPMPEGVAPPGSTGAPESGPVNLNLANAEQLEALPGVGPTIARSIVDERERNGPFRNVDDLVRVSGIGERRLEELRPHVTV